MKLRKKKSEFNDVDKRKEKKSRVYACGILCEDKLKTIWGKNTIRETIEYMCEIGKGKTIILTMVLGSIFILF